MRSGRSFDSILCHLFEGGETILSDFDSIYFLNSYGMVVILFSADALIFQMRTKKKKCLIELNLKINEKKASSILPTFFD